MTTTLWVLWAFALPWTIDARAACEEPSAIDDDVCHTAHGPALLQNRESMTRSKARQQPSGNLGFFRYEMEYQNGSWTPSIVGAGGENSTRRWFYVYVPSAGGQAGLMFFLHGSGTIDDIDSMAGSSMVTKHGDPLPYSLGWNVPATSEQYNFIGVVPFGRPAPDGSAGYGWNVDDPNQVDDVGFIHAVVQTMVNNYSALASRPKLMAGHSNGAQLAQILGCSGAVGRKSFGILDGIVQIVHYHAAARGDGSTCQHDRSSGVFAANSQCEMQGAFCNTTFPYPGARLAATTEADLGCPIEQLMNITYHDAACYRYPNCRAAGMDCIYFNLDHIVGATMAGRAWAFLTSDVDPAPAPAPMPKPAPKPSSTPAPKAPGSSR